MENLSIGTRIKQRRKELGLTQMQIKQETGISSGNMSDIENGNKLPSTPALISLSSILNCSIDWILKGENYNYEMQFLSNERETLLLNNFRKLSINDQEELIEILEIKVRKTLKGKETSTESSPLTGARNNSIAG
ncbi:helix-turn-helix domain-containing protein [Lachnospiraceae bacterium 38-10]